jgi:hypothetical protein
VRNGLTGNIPFHRRRKSIFAVLGAIAIVVVVVVVISVGTDFPSHPVSPGEEVTPPPESNETMPPETTASPSPVPTTTYALIIPLTLPIAAI